MPKKQSDKDHGEIQSQIKEAAANLGRAAERAVKLARSTYEEVAGSKQTREAGRKAFEAALAVATVAKLALESTKEAGRTLKDMNEVRSVKKNAKGAAAAAGKAATRAGAKVKQEGKKAARSASKVKGKAGK